MYCFNVFTYSSNALRPCFVILQVVKGFFPLKVFSTEMYPASESLSSCTLRLPAVEFVFSFKNVNSADSTLMRIDITPKRS